MTAAAAPSFKQDIARLIQYQEKQCELAGVKIQKGKEATASAVLAAGADRVIVATGASAKLLPVEGREKPHVKTALDLLHGRAEAGDRVAVIGGGLVGCELALSLAEQGKQVTILEFLDVYKRQVSSIRRLSLTRSKSPSSAIPCRMIRIPTMS